MVRKLVGKKVIFATRHDRSIRFGWCVTVERFWPGDIRPWPRIMDCELETTFAVFGPVIPYDEGVANELGFIGMENRGGGSFEICWEWLSLMNHNSYEGV